jgi:hypothetical protein
MIQDADPELVAKLGLSDYEMTYPSTYLPTPSKNDYQYGFITRYFVGRINQRQIIETCARDYNAINIKFFLKTKVDWQISGRKNNLYQGKMLMEAGVQEYNLIQINKAKSVLPGIETVLNNPLQFWQGY